jgi:hypothetical protein
MSHQITRALGSSELAAFDETQVRCGKWAALYAAPLAATIVLTADRTRTYFHREEFWPWNWIYKTPEVLFTASKAALMSVSDEDPEAVNIATEWLRSVLPNFGTGQSSVDFPKPKSQEMRRIDLALELLAWHLAKDLSYDIRSIMLQGCAKSAILAKNPIPLWNIESDAHAADISSNISKQLDLMVDFNLPLAGFVSNSSCYDYYEHHRLMVLTKLTPLLWLSRESPTANHLDRKILRDLAERDGAMGAIPWQTWLAHSLNSNSLVSIEVFENCWEDFILLLAKQSLRERNSIITQSLNNLKEFQKSQIPFYFWTHPDQSEVKLFYDRLVRAVQEARYVKVAPDTVIEPPIFSDAKDSPRNNEKLSVQNDLLTNSNIPQILEVKVPYPFITVPFDLAFAEVKRAGLGAVVAKKALTTPLLFFPERNGSRVHIIRDASLVPKNFWFVGDIHGDLLAFENAWRFINRTAESEGLEAHVVFLGDFIDRGKYNHEVLTRLFHIIVENPGRIGVIAGNHDEALSMDHVTGCFKSDVEPSEYAIELNAQLNLLKLDSNNFDAQDRVEVGKQMVEFIARCPRAIFLPDGTMLSHAGFPHTDLLAAIQSLDDLDNSGCLQDFAWLRLSKTAPKKIPNRTTRGCEFGFKDFIQFCETMGHLGVPVQRLIRGHDHEAERYSLPTKYKTRPILTINSMGHKLEDEYNQEQFPMACVARHQPGFLPQIYRLPIEPAEVLVAFPTIKREL